MVNRSRFLLSERVLCNINSFFSNSFFPITIYTMDLSCIYRKCGRRMIKLLLSFSDEPELPMSTQRYWLCLIVCNHCCIVVKYTCWNTHFIWMRKIYMSHSLFGGNPLNKLLKLCVMVCILSTISDCFQRKEGTSLTIWEYSF